MDPKPNQNKLIQTMSVPWLRKKKGWKARNRLFNVSGDIMPLVFEQLLLYTCEKTKCIFMMSMKLSNKL